MWPEDSEISFFSNINDSDVKVNFEKCFSCKFKNEGDKHFTEPIFEIKIEVSKKGNFDIPKIEKVQDYEKRIIFFDNILPEFSNVAFEAYSRIIFYLKYVLYNPYLIEYPRDHAFFYNAKWKNEKGEKIGGGTNKAHLLEVYDLENILGNYLPSKKLSLKNSNQLKFILQNDLSPKPQFHSQMLSGAVSSLFDLNLHRSVFELAISVESMVKRTFKLNDGKEYKYKSNKKNSPTNIIEIVASEAFGKSFAEEQPKIFKNLENLFRCRNKIAHHGSLDYRDIETNEQKIPNIQTVTNWTKSVQYLEYWFLKQEVGNYVV